MKTIHCEVGKWKFLYLFIFSCNFTNFWHFQTCHVIEKWVIFLSKLQLLNCSVFLEKTLAVYFSILTNHTWQLFRIVIIIWFDAKIISLLIIGTISYSNSTNLSNTRQIFLNVSENSCRCHVKITKFLASLKYVYNTESKYSGQISIFTW